MRICAKRVIFTFHVVASLCAAGRGADIASSVARSIAGLPSKDRVEKQQIAEGVTHIRESRTSGPLVYNVLVVDLLSDAVEVETEQGGDRLFVGEKLTQMMKREAANGQDVVAAVNGDYWKMTPKAFSPIGLSVSDDNLYTSPSLSGRRSALLRTANGNFLITRPTLSIAATIGKTRVEVDALNRPTSETQVCLYTSTYTDEIADSRTKLILKSDKPLLPNVAYSATVANVTTDRFSPSRNSVVLCMPQDKWRRIDPKRKGVKAELMVRIPQCSEPIAYSVGGGPRILRDGDVSIEHEEEGIGPRFAQDRHPRTAAGLSKDGNTLFLVTVDGRQPARSVGNNLFELAEYMRGIGCSDALNLDGGGSTTMVVNGEVVNEPSDAEGPRTISNGIFVINTNGKSASLTQKPR